MPDRNDIARLLIIYTGGTIGMAWDEEARTLVPMSFSQLRHHIPEIARLGCEFEVHSFNPPIDSSNMSPQTWAILANIIYENYQHYTGFVILHGSDTMAFTASALSFMFENLDKPIILTGSQLPIGEIRTDAKENIITAMEIASARDEQGKARVPEVCIYFDYCLFRGNRTKKFNTESFEAFRSINYPLLAEAGINIRYHHKFIAKSNGEPLKLYTQLNTDIAVLKMFPGITEATVSAILGSRGLKAVILESFGNGNTITDDWFINALEKSIKSGIVIVDRTQCDGGSVSLGRYETSTRLKQIGVTNGNDLTFEATVAKLMLLLGQGYPPEKVKQRMEISLRGELTEK